MPQTQTNNATVLTHTSEKYGETNALVSSEIKAGRFESADRFFEPDCEDSVILCQEYDEDGNVVDSYITYSHGVSL